MVRSSGFGRSSNFIGSCSQCPDIILKAAMAVAKNDFHYKSLFYHIAAFVRR